MFFRLSGWQGKALADRGFNRGTGRRDQIAQLVGRSHREGANCSRRQLHQMNGDHPPCALHAELLKERRSHDVGRGDEGVGV